MFRSREVPRALRSAAFEAGHLIHVSIVPWAAIYNQLDGNDADCIRHHARPSLQTPTKSDPTCGQKTIPFRRPGSRCSQKA